MGPSGQSRVTSVPVTSCSGTSPCDLESIEFARASPMTSTDPALTVNGPWYIPSTDLWSTYGPSSHADQWRRFRRGPGGLDPSVRVDVGFTDLAGLGLARQVVVLVWRGQRIINPAVQDGLVHGFLLSFVRRSFGVVAG